MGKWSEISKVKIPELKFQRFDTNILSMRVHELPAMRVGFDIIGTKEKEFIWL